LSEDEAVLGTDPTGEPAAADDAEATEQAPPAEPTAEDAGAAEHVVPEDLPAELSAGDQLSLDEMVESLRSPEEDAEAPSGEADTVTPDTIGGEVAADATEAVTSGDATTSAVGADAEPADTPPADAAPADAPAAAELVDAEPAAFPRLACSRRLGARLPFWLYIGAWLLFAAGMAIAMWPYATASFTAHPLYAWFVLGGAGLAVLGPVIAVVAWLVLRSGSDPDERVGLVRALFLRAAVAMLSGSLLWWAALIALDLRRAGLLG
jgi:hypothetical protein